MEKIMYAFVKEAVEFHNGLNIASYLPLVEKVLQETFYMHLIIAAI